MNQSLGRIEIICGSMFSGKTETLIHRVRRTMFKKRQVQVFKPVIDDRFSIQEITSHNGQRIEALPVAMASQIETHLYGDTVVVAIDEVQFFDRGIVAFVEKLANQGRRVILAGLNLDFRGEPFGYMAELMCRADEVKTLYAVCDICGGKASRTQRLVDGNPAFYEDPIIMIGAKESYGARCREHHIVPRRELIVDTSPWPE